MKASARPTRDDAAARKKSHSQTSPSVVSAASAARKPLHNLRFYLDVKNPVHTGKLELKIKDLGGVLELFLVKEITHVVTDREGCCSSKGGGSRPGTPQPTPHEPSNDELGAAPARSRPKTRADAMLERARKVPAVVTKDPLEEARNWGITIWSIDKALAFLERVSAAYKVANKKPPQKVFELKAPYIKFEAFNRQTRPIFQEIRNWPQINFQGSAGDPGVVVRSTVERNMTRKTRSNPRLDTALQPGYCEVCRADYLRLDEHLESDKHLTFVRDNANFLQLDTLITDTSNIGGFLKLNGVDKSGGDKEIVKNKGKRMLRPRTVSLCDKIRNSPLSPTGSDSGHRLRSRRHCTINSYVGSFNEEEVKTEGVRERELRSSTRQLLKLLENEQKDTWDSGRPKRACIRQKRSSAEDRIPIEGKMYYKVEVVSGKLRGSSTADNPPTTPKERRTSNSSRPQTYDPTTTTITTTTAPPASTPVSTPASGHKSKSLIVKFKKMRSYELRQLNDEAENFLFPKRDEDSSSDEDIDADNVNTTASVGEGDSTILLSSEGETPRRGEHLDEASLDSTWSGSGCSKKKKRRTHAEAFILDNQKYYKFETPGSRLRYHGSYLPSIAGDSKSPKPNGELSPSKIVKAKEKCDAKEETENSVDLKDLEFCFERVPSNEPWYVTFKRQDEGHEHFFMPLDDLGFRKPFLLPYELGPLPPLDPKVCVKAYRDLKKELLRPVSTTMSAGSGTPDDTMEAANEENSKTSESSNPDSEESGRKPPTNHKGGKKGTTKTSGKNPRKSPRQHASTLAILSSLIQQRKKRVEKSGSELDQLPTISEKEEVIVDEKEVSFVSEKDDWNDRKVILESEEIARKLDEELKDVYNNGDDVGIEIDDDSSIRTNFKLSAVELLNDYDNKERSGGKTVRRLFATAKKPGRKKKKNRTGWPNKNSKKKRDECSKPVVEIVNKSVGAKTNNREDRVSAPRPEKRRNPDKEDAEEDEDNDKVVDLDEWEIAERVLIAGGDKDLQPFVRVQKLPASTTSTVGRKRRAKGGGSSPHRTPKRPRRTTTPPKSPRSPRALRKPRGRWYRER